MAIGKHIEQQIKNKNMSLKEFSKLSGISYNTLYAIVKRDNSTIKPEILKKIAHTLDVRLSDLFDIGDELSYFNPEDGTRDTTVKDENDTLKQHINLWGASFAKYPLSENEVTIINCFKQLNPIGQKEALKRIKELTQLPQYLSPLKPPTTFE